MADLQPFLQVTQNIISEAVYHQCRIHMQICFFRMTIAAKVATTEDRVLLIPFMPDASLQEYPFDVYVVVKDFKMSAVEHPCM